MSRSKILEHLFPVLPYFSTGGYILHSKNTLLPYENPVLISMINCLELVLFEPRRSIVMGRLLPWGVFPQILTSGVLLRPSCQYPFRSRIYYSEDSTIIRNLKEIVTWRHNELLPSVNFLLKGSQSVRYRELEEEVTLSLNHRYTLILSNTWGCT